MLRRIPQEDAMTVMDYLLSLKSEANPSVNYRRDIIKCLTKFIAFCRGASGISKELKRFDRKDVLAFLDNHRKPEAADPLHQWIGTYNLDRTHLIRFFKWLYGPDIEPNKRPKPAVVENIQKLKRKEKSIYKPTDLWTSEDDLLFLKYCPFKREKCFHMVAKDTSCRPHEILKLKIRDITFKTSDRHQYAEALVNGKTGSRPLVLIDSIPYLKDYLDHEHPQPGNPNAPLICGTGKGLGRHIESVRIGVIYREYKNDFFPKLLDSPSVLPEDKPKIRELLKKPWNPYILRHSSLTEKSKILKEHILRQHAGWSIGSSMPQKYLHYFGNESNVSLLEAYGIVTKDQRSSDVLKPKQCPNCSEPNKPDSKFCAKCRMVLTYDAYSETIEEKKQKESEVKELKDKYEQGMKAMRQEIREEMKEQLAQLVTQLKPEVIREGLS